MREHEYAPAGEDERQFCRHCGALKHPRLIVTCLDRAMTGEQLMPEPARRVYASESWDAIGVRLAELKRERAAVDGKPAEAVQLLVMVADERDWDCG